MKFVFYIVIAFLLCSVGVLQADDVSLEALQPSLEGVTIHKNYRLHFNTRAKSPDWVIYAVPKTETVEIARRGMDFKPDPLIPESPKDKAYQRSGYDAGHHAPADLMNFNREVLLESFYTSNCSPQLPNFNRGIWKSLEVANQKWADDGRSLIILSGACYARDHPDESKIGGEVSIPTHFYKVVYILDMKLMICFLFKHQEYKEWNLSDYIVSPKEIESISGITLKRMKR